MLPGGAWAAIELHGVCQCVHSSRRAKRAGKKIRHSSRQKSRGKNDTPTTKILTKEVRNTGCQLHHMNFVNFFALTRLLVSSKEDCWQRMCSPMYPTGNEPAHKQKTSRDFLRSPKFEKKFPEFSWEFFEIFVLAQTPEHPKLLLRRHRLARVAQERLRGRPSDTRISAEAQHIATYLCDLPPYPHPRHCEGREPRRGDAAPEAARIRGSFGETQKARVGVPHRGLILACTESLVV